MSLKDRVLESSIGYRLWMAPFAEQKFAPVAAHNDLAAVRRVLDVGCGPGTNARHFKNTSYLGLDINERYVEDARRRYGREFRAVDVTKYTADENERSDFIFLNSFLHHVATPDVERILAHLSTLLTSDGHIQIIELVLPEQRSIARQLALWDRGDYPRSVESWRNLFEVNFDTVVFEEYQVGAAGLDLWQFVYFKGKGRARTDPSAPPRQTAETPL
jgi:SAM-dependent methyltransferase